LEKESDVTLTTLRDLLNVPVEKAFAYGIGAVGAGFAGGTFYINKVLIEPAVKSSEASTKESINVLKESINALEDSMDLKLIGLGVGLAVLMIFLIADLRAGFSKRSEEMRDLTREVATIRDWMMAIGLGPQPGRQRPPQARAQNTTSTSRRPPCSAREQLS
jgi:hypothetical protein